MRGHAVSVDGVPVFLVLALDGGTQPQRVLWFEVRFPVPDGAARQGAVQAWMDIL